MAFTLDTLAQELGIDPATLAAKGDVVAKWNGYLSEADTKYTAATAAQKDAEAKLAAVQSENDTINANIEKFGYTEANIAALKANNAAMEASLKELQTQGFDVKIPTNTAPAAPTPAAFDPAKFQQDVNSTLIKGFNATNRYARLYGGAPIPDDLDALAREAVAARKEFSQYVAEKYDFAGREKALAAETQKKHDDEVRAAAVKEYQEKNPVTAGNPDLQRGVASKYPQVVKARETGDNRKFANMSAREKIAASVARSRAALSQAS